MLSLLEETLKAEGFQIFIIHTSMAAKETFQVINFFSECGPESRVVLLASLEVTGVGINLTAASCWDLDIEEQAIACVHRIGQKEEVKVIRLVVGLPRHTNYHGHAKWIQCGIWRIKQKWRRIV
eukprot:TRINITY_DN4086_c1_g1_i2.p1 TRINITY_DN4086_c1_g1~~TRINITY_DN4086_c1_g1_i2.p1  ORF type:complete len:124 (-),score=17.56 TRINITY_DN4086_c1_g1_i2:315-686(-)